MKNKLVAICIALIAMTGIVSANTYSYNELVANAPEHFSHIAEDGSYRDNARGVWVDACGNEHPLCPVCETCPEVDFCEEVVISCGEEIDYSLIRQIINDKVQDAEYTLTGSHGILNRKLDDVIDRLGNPIVEDYYQASVAFVGGASSDSVSRGLQARWNWFSLRYMDYERDGFYTQQELTNAGINDPALPGSQYQELDYFATGDADSLELMGYLSVYDFAGVGCLDKYSGRVKLGCRFSGYVSAGVYREDQVGVSWNTTYGGFRLDQTRTDTSIIAGGGIEYSVPFTRKHGMTLGVGGSSQTGATFSIGYSLLRGRFE